MSMGLSNSGPYQTHLYFCHKICDNSYEVKSVMTCGNFIVIKLYWELFAYWNGRHRILNLGQICQCFSSISFSFLFYCVNLNSWGTCNHSSFEETIGILLPCFLSSLVFDADNFDPNCVRTLRYIKENKVGCAYKPSYFLFNLFMVRNRPHFFAYNHQHFYIL